MSRQKGILPFFRLSRFGGLIHFSYFCLIKNVIHENFIPVININIFISNLFQAIPRHRISLFHYQFVADIHSIGIP